MGLLLLVAGIFAGLFVCLATLYSLAQAIMGEGSVRWAHVGAILGVLAVMTALELGSVPAARLLALPLLGLALWCAYLEERWFKVFPVLHQLFAAVLIAGLVAL
ncbi:MAG: hypothetical protein ACFBWO_04360 [Paracoccaceae bacterium]